MQRKSGVLMHVSSLFGDYSIGSFGQEAKYFIDFLADCGFSYWQVLPFCLVDECNSPYQSYSAFGGNPYFIDLNDLHQKGLLTQAELDEQKQQGPYACEYVRLYHCRVKLLQQAAQRATNREEIVSFVDQNPYLDAFCRFMALKAANDEKPWYHWQTETFDPHVLFAWKFIQFTFFRQWADIRAYAQKRGVKVIGDIPFYVSLDSADVWSNRSLFDLDTQNRPVHVAGVPPDYFAQDGQLWGNPLYQWDHLKQQNYQWWQDRVSHQLSLFDGVRIDHFRAIESYWAVPAGEKTARGGHWEKGPGMDLVQAIRRAAGDRLVIAEDLGSITQNVLDLVKQSGFPGMRVFQFGFSSEQDSSHRPHHYPNNCVAYTGTHDNNTLLGYLWELDDHTRRYMLRYCGHDADHWQTGCDSILRTMFASHAGLLMLPIQDLLGYGADTRLNIPGKANGNWQYRITKEQLDSIDRKRFLNWNGLYGRM